MVSAKLLLVSVLGLLTTSLAAPTRPSNRRSYDYGDDINEIAKRQNGGRILTTGLPDANRENGGVVLRKEIREVQKDKHMWTLYLLSVDMMMAMDQENAESWYGIAGIHGVPFKAWGGEEQIQGSQNGHCQHVSILFPTWHRPYLALYEQILYGLAQRIASRWTGDDKAAYEKAARNFGIPYWDWTVMSPSSLPASLTTEQIEIEGPNGSQRISNPLYSYDFHPLKKDEIVGAPFDTYESTVRAPSNRQRGAVSQSRIVSDAMDRNAPSIRQRLYNILTSYDNYTRFAYEVAGSNQADSIEALHDVVHGITGSNGHMTFIEYASFDPIFFLHHTMLDRCFAIWQALYPDSYVTPQPATFPTFTEEQGAIQNVDTPLRPFYKEENSFWTSAEIRDTKTFNYAYPETVNGNRQQLVQTVNRLYGPSNGNAAKVRRSEESAEALAARGLLTDLTSKSPLSKSQSQEWIANIAVEKQALGQSFFIYVFLGEPDEDPKSWPTSENLVGSQCVFARGPNGKPHGSSDESRMVSATIPLTDVLASRMSSGLLGSLDAAVVTPFLKAQLQYRVALPDGTPVDNSQVKGLKLDIVSSVVDFLSDLLEGLGDVLPIWGPLEKHMEFGCGESCECDESK